MKKLKPGFFKYLTHNLWDRFLSEMIASRLELYTRNPRPDEGWQYIIDIADLIDDEKVAEEIRITTNKARSLCDEYQKIKNDLLAQSSIDETKKRFLITRLENLKKELLQLYASAAQPKFQLGWAGEGDTSTLTLLYPNPSIASAYHTSAERGKLYTYSPDF